MNDTSQLYRTHFLRTARRVALVGCIAISIFIFFRAGIIIQRLREKNMSAAQTNPEKELADLVRRIQMIYLLPPETPQLATVTDAHALASQQPFFARGQNGDKLLLFSQSRSAILYSPSRNIIVNAGPIDFGSPYGTTTIQPPKISQRSSTNAPQERARTLEIRNGTTEHGKAATARDMFVHNSLFTKIKITDASSHDYARTVIYAAHAFTGWQQAAINALALPLAATITPVFPAGEKPTQADILVILGSNK